MTPLLAFFVLAPAPPIVRERTYTWVNQEEDLKMVEVERLTFREAADSGPVRERILIRTELDGAKVPLVPGAKPEVLAKGETSDDPMTARLDRIAASVAPEKGGAWQSTFEKTDKLPRAGIGFRTLLSGPAYIIASVAYGEPGDFELRGRAVFGKGGKLVSYAVRGEGIRMPSSPIIADLTVKEGPEGKPVAYGPDGS